MSKKTESKQVKIIPEAVEKLQQASARHPLKPKFATLVNMIILQWDGTIPASK